MDCKKMFHKDYNNFVRPSPSSHSDTNDYYASLLSGEQARKLYLEEICDAKNPLTNTKNFQSSFKSIKPQTDVEVNDRNLFVAVQNNDVNALMQALSACPNRVNTVDEFGWSLLMIACQANNVESAEELLKRGIDTNIRDKAGNSATSLVIKNKNLKLADILLKHKKKCKTPERQIKPKVKTIKSTEYKCETCMNVFTDKEEHLSSIVHNINTSKGRKIPTNYVIPESNRGYQIMVKVGWDKETGLGPDGSGHKYPIKAVQKKDRKGLGHDKKKLKPKEVDIKVNKTKKILNSEYHHHRRMEVDFRRQFY